MFNRLFDYFHQDHTLEAINDISGCLHNLVSYLSDYAAKDQSEGAYNAAIDSLCEILQAHKKVIPPQ